MNDPSQLKCPECRAALSPDAAFCVSCGYRVRSAGSAREPSDQTGELVARARRKARKSRQRKPSNNQRSLDRGAEERAGRIRERALLETPLELQPVSPGEEASASAAQPTRESPDTYVEGLPAIDPARGSSEREASASDPKSGALQGRSEPPAGTAGTVQQSVVERSSLQKGRLPIYIALWLSLSVLAVLATYVWTARAAEDAPAERGAASLPAKTSIPAGSFQRGLDEATRSFIMQMCARVDESPEDNCAHNFLFRGEFPQREVELPEYQIDTAEVTNAQYQRCVKAGKCQKIDYKTCEVRTHLGLQIALRVPRALQRAEVAASCVNLAQARDYCAFAGGSLPSADQWERAARGEDTRLFPWGDVWGSDLANWGERDLVQNPVVGQLDGFSHVAPPGHFPAGKSPFGVHDMAGNLAEWVETGAKNKPAARGGSWTSNPFELRVTARMELDADARRTDVGFRCAYP